MNSMIRLPRFGGARNFYPDQADQLERFIQTVSHLPNEQIDGKGLMVPHAGYLYSGKTLYRTFRALQHFPENMIMIGPNHTGMGQDVTIMSHGGWRIMEQTIPIHEELASNILQASAAIHEDGLSHQQEHSIEVILPLLLTFKPDFHIVPILMRNYHPAIVEDLSQAIIQALNVSHSSAFIIASSDMSHYISKEEAKAKDALAIQAIRQLDGETLLRVVRQNQISMCGSGPVAVAINVCSHLGATRATLIDYTESSEETKDTSEVVSYAGFIFH